jgi:hypothetical protein
MPKNPPIELEYEPIEEHSKDESIGRQVMKALGSPKDLLKVKVVPVGGDKYRVNIVTGPDYATGKISHSFFLAVDAKGKILTSTPPIVKAY